MVLTFVGNVEICRCEHHRRDPSREPTSMRAPMQREVARNNHNSITCYDIWEFLLSCCFLVIPYLLYLKLRDEIHVIWERLLAIKIY